MRFGVDHPLLEVDDVWVREGEVEVLHYFRKEEPAQVVISLRTFEA